MLTAPLTGFMSVAVTAAVVNVLSTDRQTPPTLAHIRAKRVSFAGRRPDGWYDVGCISGVLTTSCAPTVVPTHNTYACAFGTVVHWNVCTGLTLVVPSAGLVSVAMTLPVVNVLSTDRHTPLTSVH